MTLTANMLVFLPMSTAHHGRSVEEVQDDVEMEPSTASAADDEAKFDF
jgi:hypothetical protein